MNRRSVGPLDIPPTHAVQRLPRFNMSSNVLRLRGSTLYAEAAVGVVWRPCYAVSYGSTSQARPPEYSHSGNRRTKVERRVLQRRRLCGRSTHPPPLHSR